MTRTEAIRAARFDSHAYITPAARERALAGLEGHEDDLAKAARLVLIDSGAFQGLPGFSSKAAGVTLSEWSAAADLLEEEYRRGQTT